MASLLVLGFAIILPTQVSAHVLKTDGNIGAIMHINPDDDPIAGSESTFYFDVKDKQSKFRAPDCACEFSVSQNDKPLATQPLSGSTTAVYNFPAIGIYQISFSGQPLAGRDFQAFKLSYSVRVDRTATGETNPTSAASGGGFTPWLIGGFGLLVAGFVALLVTSIRREKAGKTRYTDKHITKEE